MNNSNYGYPPTGYTPPYSSTPAGLRPQRPRFGYSGPSLYPRPRSSASKPNPDSYSDSMINNYGNSNSRIDSSFNSDNGNSFNDSYTNNSSSNYYTANETFGSNSYSGDSSMIRGSSLYGDKSLAHGGVSSSAIYPNSPSHKSLAHGGVSSPAIYANSATLYGHPKKYHYNDSSFGEGELKGSFQKPFSFQHFGNTDKNIKQTFSARKFVKPKKKMTSKPGTWRCDICSIDFTSQIPYDMHLRGAKHAKKIKARQAMTVVQSRTGIGANGENQFYCELCNVHANSSLQFQTHLEGSKHKKTLNPKEPRDPSQNDTKKVSKDTTNSDPKDPANLQDASVNVSVCEPASVNGKTNGSLTRPLPSDFGEPQPAKLTKFACDICSITVNSEVQLQQHLSSKKHQNKVEGKPVTRVRKNKEEKQDESRPVTPMATCEDSEPPPASAEASKVVGVKTLSSSFVQGGTLQ